MKKFTTEKIRNFGVFGHGGSGKTSLTEAFLFNAGYTKRLGRVDDGTTVTDFLPEETAKKITITLGLAPVEWKETKINIIDSPGYGDFWGDVKSTLRAVDNALINVSGVSGVQVRTEGVWNEVREIGLPTFIFINKLDRENADFFKITEQLREKFGSGIAPVHVPIGSEENFRGVVDLLKNKAYVYENGKRTEIEIPEECMEKAEEYKAVLLESIAECDDEILLKYLEGEELTDDELGRAFISGVKTGKVFPVTAGSAYLNTAVDLLLDLMVDAGVNPLEAAGDDIDWDVPAALVFKTIADPFVGKLSYLRSYGRSLHAGKTLWNTHSEKEEKVNSFLIVRGKEQENLDELIAGDICALAKTQDTHTGDTLTEKGNETVLAGIDFPEPNLYVSISPKNRGDEEKVGAALNRLHEEDPTIMMEKNSETKETVLRVMGDTHLDILEEKLKNKFSTEINVAVPTVPYRETIRSSVKAQGRHKKQSGGAGQFGDVWIEIAPFADDDFEFEVNVFGGSVPRNYFPAVEKGIKEAMQHGVLAKFPVTNVKATLYDGSYHPVDSNEMSFKIAGSLAFKNAMEKASPVLMEPIMDVEISVPEEYMGDIMGDLNSKRGRINGMNPSGSNQVISANVPLSEMYRYSIDLKALTHGRGTFHMEFLRYDEMPHKLAEDVITKRKEESEE